VYEGVGVASLSVRQTSLLSYHNMRECLGDRQLEYCEALAELGHPATDLEVSRFFGVGDPNYFRPRRFELMRLGVVVEVGKRVCGVSGRLACVWWFA